MDATVERNAFIPRSCRSLKLELALLAFPLAAIAVLFALSPLRSTPAGPPEKLTLRVMAALPEPDPDRMRELQLAREHIRFALSKVARPLQPADDLSAGSATAVQSAVRGAPARVARLRPATSAQRGETAHTKLADIKLARTGRQSSAGRKDKTEDGWIKRNLAWPVSTVASATARAAATLALVKDTVATAVDRAGDALESLKRKVL